MTLTLEAGKRYVTRDGRVTLPLRPFHRADKTVLLIGNMPDGKEFSWYNENGRFLDKFHTHDLDLVSEYTEPSELRSATVDEIEKCSIAAFNAEWPSVDWDTVGTEKKNAWRKAARAVLEAWEHLMQIETEKPKETVAADKIAALLNASHGQSTLEISKRILREIVQPMIVEAFVQGRENKEFSSEYAHRIIAQACGEKE